MIPNHLTRPADIAREVYGARFPLVNRYVDILRSTGIDWGLLGPREADRLWDRHILNSAALSGLISRRERDCRRRQRRGPTRHPAVPAAAGPPGNSDRAAATTQHLPNRDSRRSWGYLIELRLFEDELKIIIDLRGCGRASRSPSGHV